jgi:hypothetical protein
MLTEDEVRTWMIERLRQRPDDVALLLHDAQLTFEGQPFSSAQLSKLVTEVQASHGRVVDECGTTKVSFRNAAVLRAQHDRVKSIKLVWTGDEYVTQAVYSDGYMHTFTGFSWGYGGEGCRWLAKWLMDEGVSPVPAVGHLRNTGSEGLVWLWERT